MNTYPVPIQPTQMLHTQARQQLKPALTVSSRETVALLGALMAATTLVLLFVWVAGVATNNLIAAGTWGLGFIFLGLAIDSCKWPAIWQLAIGAALLALALLQTIVSPDFTIVSGALVATWVAFTVFRQLRYQGC